MTDSGSAFVSDITNAPLFTYLLENHGKFNEHFESWTTIYVPSMNPLL